mmetsp:Transcript_18574/g.45709  ORF Transcript_18574/g.45709 Transcript_18574/m.45709 type:complete len:221 (+) Transcript_18574:79-741(+)
MNETLQTTRNFSLKTGPSTGRILRRSPRHNQKCNPKPGDSPQPHSAKPAPSTSTSAASSPNSRSFSVHPPPTAAPAPRETFALPYTPAPHSYPTRRHLARTQGPFQLPRPTALPAPIPRASRPAKTTRMREERPCPLWASRAVRWRGGGVSRPKRWEARLGWGRRTGLSGTRGVLCVVWHWWAEEFRTPGRPCVVVWLSKVETSGHWRFTIAGTPANPNS